MAHSSSPRVVVVGGGYAGALGALELARRLRDQAEIVLVDARPHFVERIRLHEHAAGRARAGLPYATLLSGTGVRFIQARVTHVDLERKELRTADDALAYDRLLLAAGSGPSAPIPGVREHAHVLADEATAAAVHVAVSRAASMGSRVAIVGGGLTAIELAFELAHAHSALDLTLISPPLDLGLPPSSHALLERRMAAARIEHVEDQAVEITPEGPVIGRGSLPAAVTVWAAGFIANPLGMQAGLSVATDQRVEVDAELRSRSHPAVLVAGDLARPPTSVGAPVLMSCRLALPMAVLAARNLAADLRGQSLRPFVASDSLRCLSLGRRDGLIQFMHGDGRPRRARLSGRPGALVKEAVVRGTVALLRLSQRRARG